MEEHWHIGRAAFGNSNALEWPTGTTIHMLDRWVCHQAVFFFGVFGSIVHHRSVRPDRALILKVKCSNRVLEASPRVAAQQPIRLSG